MESKASQTSQTLKVKPGNQKRASLQAGQRLKVSVSCFACVLAVATPARSGQPVAEFLPATERGAIAQAPLPLPPREIPPLPSPQPPPPPQPIPAPPPATPEEPAPSEEIQIVVKEFRFEGNTAFSNEELAAVTAPFTDRPITFAQLLEARAAVTRLYLEKGFVTSGAYIPEQDVQVQEGTVTIEVLEGQVEAIQVTATKGGIPTPARTANYVRSRLELATGKPLNRERLIEALQLLRLNPLIDNIRAELLAGSRPGSNILQVEVTEAPTFHLEGSLDNYRSPTVGSFRRGVEVRQDNLLGFGDGVRASYRNTDGSNEVDASYAVPINPRNGTLELRYRQSWSNVIEQPFQPLDIRGNYRSYGVTLRQPIVQRVTGGAVQELALGLTAQRQESDTSILGMDFPLSPGADDRGRTRVSALRFFQEYSQRSERQVLVARSEFSLGVGALGATVNEKPPDSRFLAWRGQVQWLGWLGDRSAPQASPALLLRADAQLASRALVPLEQFSLGGQASVRGYRQDALLADNGVLASAELRLPVLRPGDGVVYALPFVDAGAVGNSSGRHRPDPNALVGVGLGLLWQQGDRLRLRIDYGIPLVDIRSRNKRTWQENGLYFTVEYKFF